MYPRHMSKNTARLDSILSTLAAVRDEELASAPNAPSAVALFATIVETPVDTSRDGVVRPRFRRVVAFAAAVVLAAVLSIPALGVGPEIVSLFAGWRDPDAPAPTASDIVVASGEAGVRWTLVATTSDQGLCLGFFHQVGGDRFGSAGCGYVGIRGDLPRDVRGDPSATCIEAPTANDPGGTLVPCGSLPQHWIEGVGSGGSSTVGLEANLVAGVSAEEVTSVDLVLTDGETLEAQVVERPGGLPLNIFWATWPCGRTRLVQEGPYADEGVSLCVKGGALVEMAIARDAGGRVLERRRPAWNGNPTGDPDGPPPPSSDGA
jgi:hypothetical protein